MVHSSAALSRADAFCAAYDIRVPILLAPMAGACPPALSIAVGNAGGMGACGALLMQPDAITKWATDVRAATNSGFQLNIWVPDPEPRRDAANEADVRAFLAHWGPEVPAAAAETKLINFDAQCDAMIDAAARVASQPRPLRSRRR